MRRGVRLVTLLLVLCVPIAGCASIPEETSPEVIRQVEEGKPTSTTVEPPPEGIDAPDLVRDFVAAGARPADDYAAARMHLTERAARSWRVPPELTIVDSVDTIPLRDENLPNSVQLVRVSMNVVGTLRSDHSFVPREQSREIRFRVKRNSEGQWRITNPPENLLLAGRSAFASNYRSVSVYFTDEQQETVVPDVRWVRQQPRSTLPSRVIDLLLEGPSAGFDAAMNTAIPEGTTTVSNVSEDDEGALLVNLSDLGELSSEQKRLIAAQVVLTLRGVRTARVLLQEEGTQLISSTNDSRLRPADVASYEQGNKVSSDVAPLAVVDERLVVFDEQASPVPGDAGSGKFKITKAARSDQGERLAAVVLRSGGRRVELRVGGYGGKLRALPVRGSFMSRPTWRNDSEVWTVVDGERIVRASRDKNGSWSVSEVDSAEFAGDKEIQDLRVSRDGTRLAGVVDGRIVVAGIAGTGSEAMLQEPTPLVGRYSDSRIKRVDWLSGKDLVAITDTDSLPVVRVSVDGFTWKPYNSSNLTPPLRRLTVGPGQKVIVADHAYLWQARDQEEVWEVLQDIPVGPKSIPFYPG
ncbi:LpqB family beta-propeller domain-containing protein [Actinopolyspora mortivallis]|uniref:LpqB family beta-propeller domain-containing protein n=1 Tax=Actinopolyspora mortivallis TaxID=33906 RepID=UPI000376B7B3|nr:LpqB family beta-propeller domain-containing protein [Actinopolyspora mortivallis]